ncbi:MAG: zinc-ribbon domain-containing protein [Flavobacterium sp.]|nr:zinc-ribbon domain-containing protein [Flavobacterium sp.]
MIVLLGVGKSVLKQFYLDDCSCSNCQQSLQHRFTVYGHYFSFFFIPVFPIYKTIIAECIHCRIELPMSNWNAKLKDKYLRVTAMQPPKRPWWHFLGCMGFMLVVLFFSVLIGYAYYTVKDDPEIKSLMKEVREAGKEPVMIYDEEEAEIISDEEAYEAEAPIDSIQTFFK